MSSYNHHIHKKAGRAKPLRARVMSRAKHHAMRGVSQLLLIAYSLLILKPAMPVIMDSLAHAFWSNVHIAVVHKVNGAEHVHYELAKNAKELEKEKGGAKGKVSQPDAPYCATTVLELHFKNRSCCAAPQNSIREALYVEAFPAHDYPPPKA